MTPYEAIGLPGLLSVLSLLLSLCAWIVALRALELARAAARKAGVEPDQGDMEP